MTTKNRRMERPPPPPVFPPPWAMSGMSDPSTMTSSGPAARVRRECSPRVKNGGQWPPDTSTPHSMVRERRSQRSPCSPAEEQVQQDREQYGQDDRGSERDVDTGVPLAEAQISGQPRDHASSREEEQQPEDHQHDT